MGDISLREESNNDEVDFQLNQTFEGKSNRSTKTKFSRRRTSSKEEYLFDQSEKENIKIQEIDQLNLYENQFRIKTEQKINNLVSSLSNHLNEINEESNIKLSEIRQNFFISKLKWLEKYNHEWENLFNQIASKPDDYDIDKSVKNKLEKVEKDRIAIQNEIFKRRFKKLKEFYSEIEPIYNQFSSKLKDNNVADNEIGSFKKIKSLKQKFELLLQKSTPENLNETILHEAKQQLSDPIIKLSENINTELEEYLSKRTHLAETTKKQEIEDEKASKDGKKIDKEQHEGFFNIDDLKFYIEMRKFKIDLENSIKEFSKDDRFKQYRSNLSLYIKTIVNTLSSNSQEHIKDKIERYTRLFSGQMVQFRDRPLSINEHKDALNFCIYHTANSFLVTGLKQVLASTKTAYSFAQVIVALWIRFEQFGKILLAFFYEMCPYTVPFYPTRDSNDDELTYLIASGYSLKKDGTIEDEESFLNKMRGLMKLFAAIIHIYSPNSPLSLRDGWKWLASILNLEPQSSVSPAVIHSFLTITDLKLKSTYGKQFIKLIHYIKSIYLPKLNALNLKNPQAKVQLETYVDELMKTF